jgi:hypothetical protein
VETPQAHAERIPPTRCRHANEELHDPGARRWRLTPVVTFSCRNENGTPQQQIIWPPRVSINSCCIEDLRTRERFWNALNARLDELRKPPLNESSGAVILDRLDGFARRSPAGFCPSATTSTPTISRSAFG